MADARERVSTTEVAGPYENVRSPAAYGREVAVGEVAVRLRGGDLGQIAVIDDRSSAQCTSIRSSLPFGPGTPVAPERAHRSGCRIGGQPPAGRESDRGSQLCQAVEPRSLVEQRAAVVLDPRVREQRLAGLDTEDERGVDAAPRENPYEHERTQEAARVRREQPQRPHRRTPEPPPSESSRVLDRNGRRPRGTELSEDIAHVVASPRSQRTRR